VAASVAVTGWRVGFGVGGVEGEATDWHGLQVNLRVADACDASITLDGHAITALALVELATDLWVWLNDELLFRGRIVGVDDSMDGERHTTTVRATDYRGLLARRVLLEGDQLVFSQRAQAEIVWTLVNATQTRPGGNLGITRGVIPQTQPRDRQFEAGAVTGEVIDSLSQVINGFDWQVDELRRLNIYYPRRGSDAGVTLEYGAAVTQLDRTSGSGDYANVVRVIGAEGTAARTVAAATIATDPRGRWESSTADPDLLLQSTVNDRASRFLADRADMRETYTAQLVPGFFRRSVIGPGDVATLVVRSGRLQIADKVRVTEVAVDADESGNDTTKLALVCEPGGATFLHPDVGGEPWP
jgi:hypothetical protein